MQALHLEQDDLWAALFVSGLAESKAVKAIVSRSLC